MDTIFLGIIAFVLLAWFIRSSKSQRANTQEVTTDKIPSYQEIVEMNEEDFKQWLFVFEDYQEKILSEMIAFEEENNIIQKDKSRSRRETSKSTQAIYDIFDREKSSKVVSFLKKLGKETGKDLFLEALLAKVATDRVWIKK